MAKKATNKKKSAKKETVVKQNDQSPIIAIGRTVAGGVVLVTLIFTIFARSEAVLAARKPTQ